MTIIEALIQLRNDLKLWVANNLRVKVDKVDGMGLSSNDFTAVDKAKLDGVSESASAVGKNVEGTVYTIDDYEVTAGTGAEVFNDYQYNKAVGMYSHAEGYETLAEGSYSHSEGRNTSAYGNYAHAEGLNTEANNSGAHAEGRNTIANGLYQHVQGKYNISINDTAHIVGNGTADDARSNAHTVDWDGNAWFAGDVYVDSTSGTNKDAGSTKLARESDLPFIATYGTTTFADIYAAHNLGKPVFAYSENGNILYRLVTCNNSIIRFAANTGGLLRTVTVVSTNNTWSYEELEVAPAIQYGTTEVTDGSTSTYPEGTLYVVIEATE